MVECVPRESGTKKRVGWHSSSSVGATRTSTSCSGLEKPTASRAKAPRRRERATILIPLYRPRPSRRPVLRTAHGRRPRARGIVTLRRGRGLAPRSGSREEVTGNGVASPERGGGARALVVGIAGFRYTRLHELRTGFRCQLLMGPGAGVRITGCVSWHSLPWPSSLPFSCR